MVDAHQAQVAKAGGPVAPGNAWTIAIEHGTERLVDQNSGIAMVEVALEIFALGQIDEPSVVFRSGSRLPRLAR